MRAWRCSHPRIPRRMRLVRRIEAGAPASIRRAGLTYTVAPRVGGRREAFSDAVLTIVSFSLKGLNRPPAAREVAQLSRVSRGVPYDRHHLAERADARVRKTNPIAPPLRRRYSS